MLACLSTVDSFSLSGVGPNVAESLCEWQECFLYSAGIEHLPEPVVAWVQVMCCGCTVMMK